MGSGYSFFLPRQGHFDAPGQQQQSMAQKFADLDQRLRDLEGGWVPRPLQSMFEAATYATTSSSITWDGLGALAVEVPSGRPFIAWRVQAEVKRAAYAGEGATSCRVHLQDQDGGAAALGIAVSAAPAAEVWQALDSNWSVFAASVGSHRVRIGYSSMNGITNCSFRNRRLEVQVF